MARSRIVRWLTHAGLICSSVLLALAITEVALRFLLPPRRSVSWYHYDDRYIMRHRANANAATTEWGDHELWRFVTNGRGFRGKDWPSIPDPNVRRVLMMGDSMTFGNGVETEETFPRVANEELRSSTSEWEVLNLGTSGWGPQNALAYLESEGRDIEASCLVYGFFTGNDVMDGEIYRLYELRTDGLRKVKPQRGETSLNDRIRTAMRRVPAYEFLIAHSQLFNVLRDRMVAYLTLHDPDRDVSSYWAVEPETFDRALDLSEATVTRLAELGRTRFGAFALVLIPMREQLAPSHSQADPPFPLWIADRSRMRMRSWCLEHTVPLVDLYEELPHDSTGVEPLFFKNDFHFSAKGNRRVGEILARHMTTLCGDGQ